MFMSEWYCRSYMSDRRMNIVSIHFWLQDGSGVLQLTGQQWGGGGLPQTGQPAQEENQPLREGEGGEGTMNVHLC